MEIKGGPVIWDGWPACPCSPGVGGPSGSVCESPRPLPSPLGSEVGGRCALAVGTSLGSWAGFSCQVLGQVPLGPWGDSCVQVLEAGSSLSGNPAGSERSSFFDMKGPSSVP